MYFNNIFQIIKCLTFSRIINIIKTGFSMLLSFIIKKPVMWGKPYTLFIEPSGSCNLKCPECVVGGGMLTRAKGNMSFDEFKNIIDQVEKHVIILYLYFQGEPFINKQIYKMIEYARSKKMYIITSTNGHFFEKDEQVEALIKSGIQYVIISMDGVTQSSYEKYRVGGNLAKVEKGIQNIVNSKKKFKMAAPFLALQFLVMKDNENEISLLKQKAKKWGADQVLLKTVQVYHTDKMEEILPVNEKYRRYEKKNGQWKLKGNYYNFCSKLWVGGVVSWDSKFFACCFDKDGQYSPGSLKEESFAQLWQKQQLNQFRQKVLADRFAINICRNCSEGQKVFHVF